MRFYVYAKSLEWPRQLYLHNNNVVDTDNPQNHSSRAVIFNLIPWRQFHPVQKPHNPANHAYNEAPGPMPTRGGLTFEWQVCLLVTITQEFYTHAASCRIVTAPL